MADRRPRESQDKADTDTTETPIETHAQPLAQITDEASLQQATATQAAEDIALSQQAAGQYVGETLQGGAPLVGSIPEPPFDPYGPLWERVNRLTEIVYRLIDRLDESDPSLQALKRDMQTLRDPYSMVESL